MFLRCILYFQILLAHHVTSSHLTWQKPSSNGGSKITGYILERRQAFSTRWTKISKAPITDMEYTIKDLSEGPDYDFRVSAVNAEGQGLARLIPMDQSGPGIHLVSLNVPLFGKDVSHKCHLPSIYPASSTTDAKTG